MPRLSTNRKPKPPVTRTGGAYRLDTAARLLDVSPSYIYTLIKEGRIETVEVGGTRAKRIPDREIARLLDETPAAQNP
jgi:excisionase family DNA binding protein